MPSTQNTTVEGLLATLGLFGYNNIAAAANGDVGSTLDITVTTPAWAIVGDGTILTTELANASVTGLTVDATYSLYLDYEDVYEGRSPVWTVAGTAPSTRAVAVASVTVTSHVIASVTMAHVGFNGPALEAINIVSTDD